jgi:uncharacterized protein (DUF2336 family)
MSQFNSINELKRVIAAKPVERRAEMLLHVADLFIIESVRLSDEEISLFDDVIVLLATDIEISVRALLAHRLAPISRAPINIIRKLATDDEIRVASSVLIQSERLDEATLVQTARAKSQSHLFAISQRKVLNENITDVLVERGNRDVVMNTAKNPGAKFSKLGFSRLIARSNGNDALATCVGARNDIPHELLVTLIATASEMVRAKLIAEAPHVRGEIEYALTTVTNTLHQRVGSHKFSASDAFIRSHDDNSLNDGAIGQLAKIGKLQEAIAAIATVCRVPLIVIERAISQEQWQTLLVFAKAANLSRGTVKGLLALCNRQKPMPPDILEQCLGSFDRLKGQTAQQIIEFYRMRPKKGRPN